MGLVGLMMACYGGLWGILSGIAEETDHPSSQGIYLRLNPCYDSMTIPE